MSRADNPMKAGPNDRDKYNTGPVNSEAIINSLDEVDPLRRAMCAECGEKKLTQKATGDGLETVVECRACGERF